MKLLRFPKHDPILSRIRTIENALYSDPSGEIADELMVILINWCIYHLEEEESDEIKQAWTKLKEGRDWIMEYYADIIDCNEKADSDNVPNNHS